MVFSRLLAPTAIASEKCPTVRMISATLHGEYDPRGSFARCNHPSRSPFVPIMVSISQAESARDAPRQSTFKFVYVVDDDSGIRRSIHFLLASAGYQARPFVSGKDFLEELPHLQPGCVLLDIRMPQLGGLEVLTAMSEVGRRFPVLVMTGHGDVATAVKAMKLGANDFLEKPFQGDVLLRSIDLLSKELSEKAEDETRLEASRSQLSSLRPRELEVLRGMIAGYTNREIGQKLSLSVRTVESYRADMMRKLNVTSTAEAVRFGLLFNLPPLE